MLSNLYENDTENGDRPIYDLILIVKILLLQQCYSLSDPQVERDIRDRISFMNFFGFPEKLPDRNTIWYFRERLSKTGKDRLVFNAIKEQSMSKRIRIKKALRKMHHSSRKIKENMESTEEMMQVHADPEMVHRQQRMIRNISTTRHILL